MRLTAGKYAHQMIILLACFMLYGNTIRNHYALDDEFVIRNNTLVQQGVTAIPEIFSTPYYQNKDWSFGYRPLTKAMFALEYEIFGENLPVHHFINVLLFVLCCLLIYQVFSKYFSGLAPPLFWLITVLIFAAHPVHTEVVASLKNREDILCILFAVAGLWFFLRFYEDKSWLFFSAGMLSFILAFLAKQTAAIFVMIVPLTIMARHLLSGQSLITPFKNIRFWLPVISLFILSYLFFKLPGWFMPAEKLELLSFENPLHTRYSFLNKYALAFYSLWIYIKITLFPHPLLYYYGMYVVPEPSFANAGTIAGILLFAVFIFAVFRWHKKHPLPAYGLLLFIAGLLPFLNLLVPINGIVAERMLFFPVFGFSILLTAMLFRFGKNKAAEMKLKGIAGFVFVVIILLYAGKTISRNSQWKDSVTLFSADMKYLDESVKANDIYATAVFDEIYKNVTAGKKVRDMDAKLKDVVKKYKRTLQLYPENPKAHHNLATIYLTFLNDAENGLIHARQALLLDPDNYKVYFNLGQAFHLKQKKDSAEFYYRLCSGKKSDFRQPWDMIIRLYTEGGKSETLKPYAEEYGLLFPESDLAMAALGSLYIAEKDTVNAIACFEKAIEINPSAPKEKIVPIYQYYLHKKDSVKAAYYARMLR
jgi:hypothetical protein